MRSIKNFPNFWQAFLYTFLIPFISIVPLLFIITYVFKWTSLDEIGKYERNIQHFATIPIVLFFFWKSKTRINKAELARININHLLLVSFFTFIGVYLFHGCILIIKTLLQREYPSFVTPQINTASIIHALILSPIIEEILYRRIFLHQFLKQYPTWLALALSSILFAFPHFPVFIFPELIIPFFISGLFLGIIYYKTQSFILCIISHSIMNLLEYIPQCYWPVFNLFDM